MPCIPHPNDSSAYSNVTQACGGHQVYTSLQPKTVKSLLGHHNLKVKVHSLYMCINNY